MREVNEQNNQGTAYLLLRVAALRMYCTNMPEEPKGAFCK